MWDVLGIDYFGLSFWFNGVLMFYGKPICVCHAFNFNDTLTLHFYKLITHGRETEKGRNLKTNMGNGWSVCTSTHIFLAVYRHRKGCVTIFPAYVLFVIM